MLIVLRRNVQSARWSAHDAFVRELRDFLRAAGAVVMLEAVHILPHLPDAEQPGKQQGERYIPDLQITHLDDTG